MVGVEDALEQRKLVVFCLDELRFEERKRHLVTGAINDDVRLLDRAVDEAHRVVFERLDIRLRRNRAVREAVENATRNRGMRVEEAVIGFGQPVTLHVPDDETMHDLTQPPANRPRDVRRDEELIEGAAEHVFRNDVHAAARGEECLRRDLGRLDRDVHRAIAHSDDDDALSAEKVLGLVMVCVHLPAVERGRGTAGSGS